MGLRDSGTTDAGAMDQGVDTALPDLAQPDTGPISQPAVIWAHSGRELFRFDPTTERAISVGIFDSAERPLEPGDDGRIFFSMTDLAVRSDGAIFGLGRGSQEESAVWRIDPEDARCTLAVRNVRGNSMSFVPAGVISDREELVVAYEDGDRARLARVDIPAQRTEDLATFSGECEPSGDIASIVGLGTFVTLRCASDESQDYLARLNVRDATIERIGPTSGIAGIWGLGFWAGTFYGFTRDGDLISIDAETGSARIVNSDIGSEDGFWGAGVTPDAPLI